MATNAAGDYRVRDVRPVDLAARSTAPLLKRGVLIPIRCAACGARLVGVGHAHARVVRRPRPPDEIAVRVAAAHDRLAPLVRLLEHRRIQPISNHGTHTQTLVIDNLGADRARRKAATDHAMIHVNRRRLGTEPVVVAQANATTHGYIICDHQTVFGAHHART